MLAIAMRMIRNGFGIAAGLLVVAAGARAEQCANGHHVPVKGTIKNNIQVPTGLVGVATFTLDTKRGKGRDMTLICGLLGTDTGSSPTNISYRNTAACDDETAVALPNGVTQTIHSQITLQSVGSFTSIAFCNGVDASGGVSGTFVETSTPSLVFGTSSGRGIFAGVTEGALRINGVLNCTGSTNETLQGYVCLPRLP